jgi:spore germination protein GerM
MGNNHLPLCNEIKGIEGEVEVEVEGESESFAETGTMLSRPFTLYR